MLSRKFVTILLTVAACSLLLVGPVLATPSYNYALGGLRAVSTVPEGHYVQICDRYLDFGHAYARYETFAGEDGVQANGDGDCKRTGYKNTVFWHNACLRGSCEDRSYH